MAIKKIGTEGRAKSKRRSGPQDPVMCGGLCGIGIFNLFCYPFASTVEPEFAVKPTTRKREKKDLLSGFIWKLNSCADASDPIAFARLRNWRLRRFTLCEDTDLTKMTRKGVLSYMSEKLEGVSTFNFELSGKYSIEKLDIVDAQATDAEKSRILLDNETYEVAFGNAAGSLQSTDRKASHIPEKLYALRIKVETEPLVRVPQSTISTEVSVTKSEPETLESTILTEDETPITETPKKKKKKKNKKLLHLQNHKKKNVIYKKKNY